MENKPEEKSRLINSGNIELFKYIQKNCRRMDYFQVMRFIYKMVMDFNGEIEKCIIISPPLFSKREGDKILSVEKFGNTIEIQCARFAIYGSLGCMPEGFNRRLIDFDNDGFSEPKDFINVFQNHLHHLYFTSIINQYTSIKCIEFDEMDQYEDLLHSFIGVSQDFLKLDPEIMSWFPYLDMLNKKVRNSRSLKKFITKFFSDRGIDLEFKISEYFPIIMNDNSDQISKLGESICILGETTYTDGAMVDTSSCIKVDFDFENIEKYDSFVFGELIHVFVKLINAYARMEYKIVFSFRDIKNTRIYSDSAMYENSNENILGMNSWIKPNNEDEIDAGNKAEEEQISSKEAINQEDINKIKTDYGSHVLLESHHFLYNKFFYDKKDESNT
jgi:predicted component of type VI protein secretion system